MKKFIVLIALLVFALYEGYQWLSSPKYMEYILKNKKKPWASRALLKTAKYYLFADDLRQAEVFIDQCLSEDFEDRPERPDCLYEKAKIYDGTGRLPDARDAYGVLLRDYPSHPKADLARQRYDRLKMGF